MREGDRFGLLDDPKVRKLEKLPEGWKVMHGTFTQPVGWLWAENGKSVGSGERETVLVKEDR